MDDSDKCGALRVKKGKKRTTEGSLTASKGEEGEGVRMRGREGGWRRRVMNALTVTTSSIK